MKIIQPPAPTGDPTLPDGDGFPTRVRWAMREVHQTLGCFERSFRGRPRPVCDAERLAEVLARAGRARITLGLGHGGDLNLAHPIAIVDQRLRQLSQELALIRDQAHRGAPDER
ncbi:MAG TPA: hypothetical protein PKA64_08615, partial [Myxococcota bacterium]|nr:hypothetical protein [Myxococcota bacterium]